MELLCLGLNHRTASVEVRERYAVPEGDLSKVATLLSQSPGLEEAVIVSTCNRVEYYVAAPDDQDGFAALSRTVAPLGNGDAEHFFRYRTTESIRHLFRVASGLDSMILGETEILGQLKKAYAAAQGGGATSRWLNKLFQRAFNVAKEVRTQTQITRGAVSVGSVAVDLAGKIFGRLPRCRVMILGAGETAELTAGALRARGVASLFVANRSYERAAGLAEKVGGRAIRFEQWSEEVHTIDILIGSTAAPHPILTKEKLAPVMRDRPDRPLFCIDLAVPRDFDPDVNDLDGVYLYDIDSLQGEAENGLRSRRQEIARCEEIIERHVQEFVTWVGGPPPGGAAPGAGQ